MSQIRDTTAAGWNAVNWFNTGRRTPSRTSFLFYGCQYSSMLRRQFIYCASRVWGYLHCMDWQQLVSLMIVAAAAGLLLAGKFRRRRFSFQGETPCGCGGVSRAGAQGSVVFRARKGGRPEVLVKMK